ncbi:hypothetical protein K466DRAFT_646110 [Polyporus arcularius HHB13444]|uniref:DUF7082 domain-containing protein n=1 Tax=Polyporus arcularius HHB13444 TaxID=1314778 RepID=A0A5C3PCN8_9APHY|nr:hypothetical protein K466DRAFT_646110 [Polyporus arcularius HHB13444]
MLSALSSTPHTFFNGPSCSYDSSSQFLPIVPHLTPSAMHSKFPGPASYKAATSRPYIASPGDLFRVYGYTPHEGGAGTSITVTVRFIFESTETTFLRIVVGNRALSTAVSASSTGCLGEWDLEATAPDFEAATAGSPYSSESTVPLTVQALNSSNTTIDSVTFGKFTYCTRASPLLLKREGRDDLSSYGSSSASSPPDLRNSPPALVTRRNSRPTPGNGTPRARGINATMSPKDAQSARGHLKKQSLIRARRSASEDDDADSSYRAVLAMETPTDPMGNYADWDADEREIGRRLVRFTRVQDGCTLHVACESIRPSEYADGDTVVSCIYRPADAAGPGETPASQCCITSVDIIFLLECIVGDIFNIEEKNRIRRNLEGFRPRTVSKNKVGTEEFFQKIMDFPPPKPRNIEKDVKVFDWTVLPQALDKIISKYTLYPNAKKKDGSATPPILDNMGTSPLLSQSSIGTPYSASSSPVPNRGAAESPEQSYFFPQTTYHSQFVSPSLDPLDSGNNNYVTASTPSSASTYDRLFSHPHRQSTSSSPMITPLDSPMVSSGLTLPYSGTGDQFMGPSLSFAPSFSDQGAFEAGSFFTPSFDSSRSPPADLHRSQYYL